MNFELQHNLQSARFTTAGMAAGSTLCLGVLSVVLVVVAWTWSSSFIPWKSPPVANFDGTVYFNHDNLKSPTTKDEIVEIVKFAAQNGRKIRVLGSGHSRSALALSEDILVSLHKFKGLVEIDLESKQVTVRGGTTLKELNAILEEKGLALSNMPAIADPTIAGAIATGTHGTGLKHGNLGTFVTKLELVSGKGELLTASAVDNVDIFKAAQVSVGMLGVITEVTLQCEEAFHLEETLVPHPLDYCLENLEEIVHDSEYSKVWMELFSGTCATLLVNRTKGDVRTPLTMSLWDLKMRLLEPFLWVASWIPSLTPSIMRLTFNYGGIFPAYNRVDVSYGVFVPPPYFPNNNQAEMAVDMVHCVEALKELKTIVETLRIPVNLITEVRFVKGDDIWLSPDYGRDSCHITLMIYNPSTATKQHYFDEFLRAIERFQPRFHWGKYLNLTPDKVKEFYPRAHDFARIRAQLDPKGIFVNLWASKVFGFLE